MAHVYSTYEAKSRFSEVMRKVRAGQRVVVTYRGQSVAEIRPLPSGPTRLADSVARLEAEGLITPALEGTGEWEPVARREGALERFLEDRE